MSIKTWWRRVSGAERREHETMRTEKLHAWSLHNHQRRMTEMYGDPMGHLFANLREYEAEVRKPTIH